MQSRLFLMLVLVIGWMPSWGQSDTIIPDRLQQLMATSDKVKAYGAEKELTLFIEHLAEKNLDSKDDLHKLRFVFKEAHRKFFKTYSQYSSFNEVFTNGRFDCLTATGFFSLILDQLGFQYQLIETNYHIFLLVEINNGRVLVETTDAIRGIITDPDMIEKRLQQYRKNELLAADSADKSYYHYRTNLFKTIQFSELIGLLYFNKAVVSLNQDLLADAVINLKKSFRSNNVERISEFARLLFGKVMDSQLDQEEKVRLVKPLIPFISANSPLIASR